VPGTRLLMARRNSLDHRDDMMALINPNHIDRKSICLGRHTMSPGRFEDIDHSSVWGQCLLKGQPKEQLLRRIGNLGFQFGPVGEMSQ
jgi:hypothetical protein